MPDILQIEISVSLKLHQVFECHTLNVAAKSIYPLSFVLYCERTFTFRIYLNALLKLAMLIVQDIDPTFSRCE